MTGNPIIAGSEFLGQTPWRSARTGACPTAYLTRKPKPGIHVLQEFRGPDGRVNGWLVLAGFLSSYLRKHERAALALQKEIKASRGRVA